VSRPTTSTGRSPATGRWVFNAPDETHRDPSTMHVTDDRRSLLAVSLLTLALLGSVTYATGFDPGIGADGGGDGVPAGAELRSLHDRGVTGENVSVGVVDVTGFDTGDPAVAEQTVAARAFAPGETVANDGRTDHGTAAASLVTATAPDADLYLASFDTPAGYRRAVAWLLREDVDVLVAPVAFYGRAGDGSSAVARVTRAAAENGVVVVAPAGNLGRSHWDGTFTPTTAGRHRFDDGTRTRLVGDGREVRLWLSWRAGDRRRDFDLELYRVGADGSTLVARSRPYSGDDTPNERIVTRVRPNATHVVVVSGPANASGTPLELVSPTHELGTRDRSRSVVAPATAAPVLTVGAYDPRRDRVEPFSSAGPVAGRPGVDVVAPDRLRVAGRSDALVGSSAAAPYAAGVVALVLDVNPDLSRRQAGAVVERSASDLEAPATVAGDGRVAPRRAVALARNVST
jgi:subtilisin family serine protease